jgi:uncharacterized hydrophobic protein (TIGR00271 family)
VIHRRALALLHLTPSDREEQVHAMLAKRQRGAVEYWTFLMLSMAIATLGLAMNSTTVVIGAMLVSPLMGPIVEFAMGLVVGSPVLTVRSLFRIVGSVVLVVGGAALLTLVLPFREVTAEIATRTEPTLMDLALAGFVALAATLTVVKAHSETNIVAAGAAIGIALVPPVCVIGFGLGIADLEIAAGASLLLVTNFTAIIFVGAVFFYLLGYERVSVRRWDEEALAATAPDSYLRRVLMGVDRVFGSSRSRLFRILVPGLVFGLLALPLSRALDRVSWEVQASSAVRRILADLPPDRDFIETTHSVGAGQVSVRTYVMGATVAGADSLQAELARRIAAATHVPDPEVRVIAVPNYGAVRRATEQIVLPATRTETRPEVELAGIRQEMAGALERTWPTEAYGPLVGWRMALSDSGGVDLHLHHLGPAPDAGAAGLLAGALGPRVPTGLRVHFAAVDTTVHRAPPEASAEWLPLLGRAVAAAGSAPGLRVCVELPDTSGLPRRSEGRVVARAVPGFLAGLPRDRYVLGHGGTDFQVRVAPLARRDAPEVRMAGDSGAAEPEEPAVTLPPDPPAEVRVAAGDSAAMATAGDALCDGGVGGPVEAGDAAG